MSEFCTFATVPIKMSHLTVEKLPRSGTPEELQAHENIDAQAIVNAVRNLV